MKVKVAAAPIAAAVLTAGAEHTAPSGRVLRQDSRPYTVSVERRLAASPERAWQVLGRFCAIAQWQSLVASCDVVERADGIMRIVVMRDHSVFTERLDEYSSVDRRFSYSLVAGPLVPPDYHASFSIRPHAEANASILTLDAAFSAPAAEGDEIAQQLRHLFDNGLNGIDALLAGRNPAAVQGTPADSQGDTTTGIPPHLSNSTGARP